MFVILLHATILGMTLKGLVSVCSQQGSSLVGKAYLRKANACKYIIFNILKSNTVLKIILALIPVNKDLEYVHI